MPLCTVSLGHSLHVPLPNLVRAGNPYGISKSLWLQTRVRSQHPRVHHREPQMSLSRCSPVPRPSIYICKTEPPLASSQSSLQSLKVLAKEEPSPTSGPVVGCSICSVSAVPSTAPTLGLCFPPIDSRLDSAACFGQRNLSGNDMCLFQT